ncbi:MAG: DNA-binding response regulator [Bacteroidetes bacterium HGW-Bacteroidetes-11]|jgi:DNA-binding NarL/FixJ family response regulator|nr:MAG: DNA-binding response regulator [Bacteroidetes bacterium HGW-Bacteroidetes-11]
MHRILLVDDHELIIDGLRNMLLNTDLLVVGDARNGDEAIEKASELLPDVIIMDVSMPQKSGIEATGIIKKQFPDIKILVLTQHESNDYIMQMLKAGADGYLLKNCKKSELIEAIQNVLSDEKHLGKGVSSILMDSLIKSKQNESDKSEEVILTPREKEIIKLIATDISNKEIADMLNISLRTVETHRRNIMLKLNVNNAVALVRYAVKHGIVDV